MVRASVRACRFGDDPHSTRSNVASVIDVTTSVQRHSQPEAELNTFFSHTTIIPPFRLFPSQQHEGHSNPCTEGQLLVSYHRRHRERGRRGGPVHSFQGERHGGPTWCQSHRGTHDAPSPRPQRWKQSPFRPPPPFPICSLSLSRLTW
jgi:hypothetical protein